ncbi:MAG: BrxA/BrxB family bacilliredoxin [Bacteroidota bacterium]|nr:BrxA/BrxB family bacilliredoxin [Bacteroidota bacterium]MDP4234430.1 BrxA/BrxB family bacilliredoxin [Bacteroidota bacterium]MDP4243996.1 BrxA/BrxB family bacilliredoxin [Bacteroidota bacterium]MDP4288162.1 BrxA/BrxB family bacilliredoxin [Bacteroidota bacterium]
MYDPILVQPMREEVTRFGVKEARTAEEIDNFVKQEGTTLVFINSVCGCAAGSARPALAFATQHTTKPDRMITAFAGNDVEAVARARGYFTGIAPSSPSFGLLRDGELVWMLERWQIEGHGPAEIAGMLTKAFDEHCGVKQPA